MYDSSRASTPIFPDRFHHWFGRILSLVAIATLFLGVWTLQKLYGLPSVAPYVLLALQLVVPFIFYIVFLVRAARSGFENDQFLCVFFFFLKFLC